MKYTLITKEDVAKAFGFKRVDTVTKYIKSGKIPQNCIQKTAIKGKIRFKKEILFPNSN